MRGTGFQMRVNQTSRCYLGDLKERIGSKNRVFSFDKSPEVGREVNWVLYAETAYHSNSRDGSIPR